MDIPKYELDIKRHAFIRAMQRGLNPDIIENVLKGGKVKRFGKDYVKFTKKYKKFKVVCVGQICGTNIKILTIEKEGEKK